MKLTWKIFRNQLEKCNGFDEDKTCTIYNPIFKVGFWHLRDAKNYYSANKAELKLEWIEKN